jgi:hypothetical protein
VRARGGGRVQKRALDEVALSGPPVLRDGGQLAREERVVGGDTDGGGGEGVRGVAGLGVAVVLLRQREVGGLEREGAGRIRGRLLERKGSGLRRSG